MASGTMKLKSVLSTWIKNESYRLDCGPYMSGAIETKYLIQKLTVHKNKLHELTNNGIGGIINAGRISRIWVDDSEYGYPFLSSTDILQADLSSTSFIAKSVAQQNQQLLIKKNWTLITRSGSIGRMAYARSDMGGMACTEDVLRVIPDEDKVLPGYIYAYLSSKFGVPLVISGTYGSIITHLEPHHIADLPVPRLDEVEERAHELMQQSSDLLSNYQANICEATRLFFESVGLEDITVAEWKSWGSDLGFTTVFNSSGSLRALNYNPRFQKLCDRIKKGSWKALGEICYPDSIRRGDRFLRVDGEPEYSYLMVGQKQIFWLRPEGRWIAKRFIDDELIVKPGTILIAAVGTLADSEVYCRSEFIWGKASERAYSEHFYKILPDDDVMPPGCLFAFLRSEMAFRMLRSISYGTKLQIQRPDFLNSLPIPYPEDRSVREKIHGLVVSAYEFKDRAIDLEDEARSLVEKAIEEAAQ